MFYFYPATGMTYHWILVAAAVIPALFLMLKVYRSDRLEKESPKLLIKLVIAGVLSTLLAQIEERIGETLLSGMVSEQDALYNIILYFVIVAFAEETSKYLFLKGYTWKNPEFNCQFDGVVYAVFVSLGFALWENISYVLSYGMSTAILRACTAIPGHASFGVFMGIFYGLAKKYSRQGREEMARFYRFLAICIPAFLHGAYDYIATVTSSAGDCTFLAFIAGMFILAYVLVNRMAKKDRHI